MIYSILLNALKKLTIHYYLILHEYKNTRTGKSKFKNFYILLDSECSNKIVMGRIIQRLGQNKFLMQWNTQAGNITTNIKVEVNFTKPELSAMNVVTWKYHVDDSANGR